MIIAAVLAGLVALIHLYFMFMEMFLWTSPGFRQSQGMTTGFARDTKPLAARQGLYNGFLAAGLIWGIVHPDASFGYQIQAFVLACILIAALHGGWTARKGILYVQGIPAAAAWIAVLTVW
ncbi:DUF1304 domain-containing protein [Cohnella boryungensis]|uniref:DUF1304 domain-containing protein n=1 Tax=Cohnella boryungensis TaxID=768479 RepID=A0ABV8S6N1_9BACL